MRRAGRRLWRIDKNDNFGGFGSFFGFAEADGFDTLVVQPEILGKIVADDFRAGFGEQANLIGIALRFRRSDNGEPKRILFEIFSRRIQRFLVLQLGVIRLVEDLFRIIFKFFRRLWAGRPEIACAVSSLVSLYPRFSKNPRSRKLCWRASISSRKAATAAWASSVNARACSDTSLGV
jgi:hypothetical protein